MKAVFVVILAKAPESAEVSAATFATPLELERSELDRASRYIREALDRSLAGSGVVVQVSPVARAAFQSRKDGAL